VYRFSQEGGFVVSEEINQTNGMPEPERIPLYCRVSVDGQEPMRAVAYLRVSADEAHRARQLLEQQVAVNRFAESVGYQVVRWYVDIGTADSETSALDQLMAEAALEKRGFDYVLVRSFSRLSRRPDDLARLRRSLEDLGVELVSASETVVEIRVDDLLTALGGGEFDVA